tara:strand:+ start:1310 stop:1822 length:513 start_codon:yes stop_codon:yes gene_type:complete
MSKFKATKETVLATLNRFAVFSSSMEEDKSNIAITSISYTDKTGKPFTYEKSKDPYAIVNFKAITEYQMHEAFAEYQKGNYTEALGRNLSLNMSPEQARKLSPNQRGILYTTMVPKKDDPSTMIVVADSFTPTVSEKATFGMFGTLVASLAPTENAEEPATETKPKTLEA